MLNENITFSPNTLLDLVLKVLISAAGIALLGGISIPLEGELNLTLQTLMVLLPALLFGWKVGGGAVLLYILAGGLGLPIFPEGGSGWERITGFVGGFYWGFFTAAVVVGWCTQYAFARSWGGQALLWLGGHLIILVMGYWWLASVYWAPSGIEVWSQFKTELMTKIPGAVVKSALGLLIVLGIQRALHMAKRSRNR